MMISNASIHDPTFLPFLTVLVFCVCMCARARVSVRVCAHMQAATELVHVYTNTHISPSVSSSLTHCLIHPIPPPTHRSNIGVNNTANMDLSHLNLYRPYEQRLKWRSTMAQAPGATPTNEFAERVVKQV